MILVVLVRGYYGDHGNCCYFVLLGQISSSKAGFVQYFERREQFRRSVFFFVATYKNGLVFVGRHQKYTDLQKHSGTFPFFSLP